MLRRANYSVLALLSLGLGLSACGPRKEVTLGIVLNETIVSEPVAESYRRGIELGYEHIQADPDLAYTVHLEVADRSGGGPEAAQAASDLYRSGALAVIGGTTTEDALAIAKVADEVGRVFITPAALSDELSGISRTFFRVVPTAMQQASAMANFATETLDVNDLVIVAAEDRAFTDSLLEGLKAVFAQYGGNVKEVIYFSSDSSDLSEIVDQALALEPTGLYLAAYSKQTIGLLEHLRKRGYGRTEGKQEWVMTTSVFSHPVMIAEAGQNADGVYLTIPIFDTKSEEEPMAGFVSAYREKYGVGPDFYSAHAYDSILVFAAALKKAVNTLPQELIKGMRAIEPLAGVAGNIQFDEDGNVQKFPRIHLIRGGELIDFNHWRKEREEEIRAKIDKLRRETVNLRTQQKPGE